MVYVNKDGELAHGMQKIGKDITTFQKKPALWKKAFKPSVTKHIILTKMETGNRAAYS